jgi:glutathione synthase
LFFWSLVNSDKDNRYLHALTHYYNTSPAIKLEGFPPNITTAGLAEGLAEAHKAYGIPGYVFRRIYQAFLICHRACILFVVQAGERNVFDQRWLEYELLEKYALNLTVFELTLKLDQTLHPSYPPDL